MASLDINSYEKQIDYYKKEINLLYVEYEKIISEDIESGLSGMDYAFAMLIGIMGAIVTSSEEVQKLLDQIHQIASTPAKEGDNLFEEMIKLLLGHYKTNIDTLPNGPDGRRTFPTRVPNAKRTGPHRIFWGHDIFSTKKDNPFLLMIEQTGSVSGGIIAALKHLTADTFSKQGLPIPTSSWWDYTYDDGEKVGNKLLDFCNKLYEESGNKLGKTGGNNEFFNHMFSIHIQDVAVQNIGKILCERYLKLKKIKDDTIKHQFQLICYAVMFYMNSMIGFLRYKIPYINWAACVCMTREYILLFVSNWRMEKKLERETNRILALSEDIENQVQLKLEKHKSGLLINKMRNYIE